uniref:Uncharacterized protein n=1 Tax=Avena sativa TaxID=4498 RepID=A0ACD5USK4_AVESA
METEIMVRNSPEMPQDVLLDIFALLEIPDLMRAGSVCSSWRSAYTTLCSQPELYKRPQTPCLFYTSESAGENAACLYSLAEKRVYSLTLPDPPIRSRYLIGSSHGWLVTADERSELHLVNLITGQQIALPSVITNESVKPIFDDAGTINEYELSEPGHDIDLDFQYVGHYETIHALDKLRDFFYFKTFIFPDPSMGSYIVVLIHGRSLQISFARAGDCKWTLLPPGWDYQQCIYMDGLLYAFTRFGRVDTFDLTGPTFTMNTITDDMKNYIRGCMYVVQAPCGNLLQVRRDCELIDTDDNQHIRETQKISLYKVDLAAKELVEMKYLHDRVLFLGYNQSQYLNAKEFPQLKPNCVYFTDDESCASDYKNNCRDIGVLNLENDTREEILPQLWCSWPSPIWITPSLAGMNWSCTDT